MARTQAIPGQPGLEHRIGGLEKAEDGGVSYDPDNHEQMTHLRADKVERIADSLAPTELHGQGGRFTCDWMGRNLWCDYFSCAGNAGRRFCGIESAFEAPQSTTQGSGRYYFQIKKVIVPELNLGQLSLILRAKYLVDAIPLTKVQGKPFKVSELREAFHKELS